jgi:hypothetical protein
MPSIMIFLLHIYILMQERGETRIQSKQVLSQNGTNERVELHERASKACYGNERMHQ